jgi:predicted dinucleotide-utilizing enzyme
VAPVHERSIVGVLFPGQMGAAVGNAVRADVVWASEGRSDATRQRAATFEDVGSVDELVRSSDVILSICPPAIAEEVAEQVFGLGFEGLFVEANAITPERMRRIGRLGPRVVDGSILAASGSTSTSPATRVRRSPGSSRTRTSRRSRSPPSSAPPRR